MGFCWSRKTQKIGVRLRLCRSRTSIGGMIHGTNIIKADYVDHENEDGKDKRKYLVVGDLS